MKKFKIFKSDGTTEEVSAESVTWKKKGDGLALAFSIGRKVSAKFTAIVCLVEISEPIKGI